MTTDLADVLGDKESTSLEFKQSAGDLGKIGKTICAFANDLLKLTEFRDSGKILDRPSMTVQRAVFKGKPVVHIHVEASSTPPVRYDGVV